MGGILIDPTAMDKITSILPSGSFYKEAHNRIYDAMIELNSKGEAVDTLTLTYYLKKHSLIEKVGGAYTITGLADDIPSAANVVHYADIVREKYILRQIIAAGHNMVGSGFDDDGDPAIILDEAEKLLYGLQRNSSKPQSSQIKPILSDALAKLDLHHQNKGSYTGVASGYRALDEMTNGFQASDLVILAGRPSMGKTALALNIAANSASFKERHYRVGIFSMEMSNYQIAMRFITSEAKVNSHNVRKGNLGNKDWPKISRAASRLSELPIFVDDTPGLDILELRSRIRRMKSDYDIDMVIIDYMQLITSRGKVENRQQEMSDISRSLKSLARELDIAVLALSQLSRAVEQRPGKEHRPIMSDLRESGAIEQDADVILFIYRPWVYSQKDDDTGKAEIIIGKQRNGPTGTVHLTFQYEFSSFFTAAPEGMLDDYSLPTEETVESDF